MKLTDILTRDCILVPLQAREKGEAIRELVHALAARNKCTDEQKLLKAVMDREGIRSTGIGQGLAVPHGKSDACTGLVMALGIPSQPIDFQSRDAQPAEIIALLASPHDQTGPHIQALARISRLMLMNDFRSSLATAKTAEEVYDVLSRFDA